MAPSPRYDIADHDTLPIDSCGVETLPVFMYIYHDFDDVVQIRTPLCSIPIASLASGRFLSPS